MCKIDLGLQNFMKGLWYSVGFMKGCRSINPSTNWTVERSYPEWMHGDKDRLSWVVMVVLVCLQMGVADEAACPVW